MHANRVQFLEALDPRVIPALVGKLSREALGGDMEATKVLLGYACGRPQQAVELSGPDGSPLGLDVGSITMIILSTLAGDEHASARFALAARFKELADDARDRDGV